MLKKYQYHDEKDPLTKFEDYYFVNNSNYNPTARFLPVLAGISKKNPDYIVRHHRADPFYSSLFVIEYVTAGVGYIEVGKTKYTIKKGDLYILNRGFPHVYYADRDNPFEKKWVNVYGKFMNHLAIIFDLSDPVIIAHFDAEKYIDRMHMILSEYGTPEKEKELMQTIVALFYDIEEIIKSPALGGTNIQLLKEIKNYIGQHITDPTLIVANLSRRFFISERTIRRLFQRNGDDNPVKYIMSAKINYSKYLLATTDDSIELISDALNFSSSEYFRLCFKNDTGMSPIAWKKNLNQGEKSHD